MSFTGDSPAFLVAGLVALTLVTCCVACSDQGPVALRGPAQTVVRAAADRTSTAGGARVDVTIAADLAGSGTVDLSRAAGSLTFSRTGAQAHLDDHFEAVWVGATEWLRADGPAGSAPGATATRPWLMGPPRAVAGAAHHRVSPLDTVLVRPGLGTDVAFLRGAVKVKPYGGEEVAGVNAYRFSLEVDMQAAIANSPPADRPALQAAADAIGPVLWPADVWLDAQGRVRRLQMAEDPFTHTTTTKPNLLFTQDGNYLALTNIQFNDFGAAVAINPPPADQAVEASWKSFGERGF